MGKIQSKHVYGHRGSEGECLLVNAHINGTRSSTPSKSIEDIIWKQQCATGLNLAHYEASEFSFCLTSGDHCINKLADEEKIPLKVVLPPQKLNNATRILTIDHEFQKKDFDKTPIESETDNTKIGDGINVEEFECGVSVEGSEKQEWSFTFYDFDGRGKITKDDISSLMKSLCDAVGSSIKLTPTGMKTLRLKLTVAPDSSKVDNTEVAVQKENFKLNNLSSSPVDEKKTKRPGAIIQHRRHLGEMMQKNIDRQQRHSNIKRHNSDQRGSSEEPPRHRHAHRDKNTNHNVQESQDRRNYYLDLAGVENNNTSTATTTVPAILCNYSSINNQRKEPQRSKHQSAREHYQRHQRSRSSDVKNETNVSMERYIRLLEETQEHGRSKSHEPDMGRVRTHRHSSVPLKSSKRPVSLPVQGTVEEKSPHHGRRHRHSRDKHLAMQQVAEWIEREDLWGGVTETTVTGSCSFNEMMIVQRHEHHHMHEHHHHHHYHHYNET